MKKVDVVLDAKARLGEGPSWDMNSKVLYWVDSLNGHLNIYNPDTNENRILELHEQIGCVVPNRGNEVIVAMKSGFYNLDLESGKRSFIVDPEESQPDNSFNDGKCDPRGRFWAGTVNTVDAYQFTGSLYRLDPDGHVQHAFNSVGCSNGITWSPDDQTMYYIDTLAFEIVAFDYDIETGGISNKRVVVDIPDEYKLPDGMSADVEGKLWVAHWDAAKICRWNPENGQLMESIDFPALRITSCVFGGEQLDELYVTSAREGLDDAMLQKYPYSGALFRVKMDVQGLPTFYYAGQ